MSQQGITIVSLVGPDDDDMGDLEYIQGFVISGNYFQVSGDIDAINDTIEFIPAIGKRVFMIEAKIIPNNTSTTNKIIAALKIDTVTKDEAQIFRHFATAGIPGTNQGGWGYGLAEDTEKFNVLGLSLIGDGAKKIEIENILDSGGAFATMSGYLV